MIRSSILVSKAYNVFKLFDSLKVKASGPLDNTEVAIIRETIEDSLDVDTIKFTDGNTVSTVLKHSSKNPRKYAEIVMSHIETELSLNGIGRSVLMMLANNNDSNKVQFSIKIE